MNNQADALLERARASFDRGDYVGALADVQEIVENHPHFADVRHLMGLCLSLLGRPEEALEQFDLALAENDAYIDAYLSRAITLNELGRFDEAAECLEQAAECEHRGRGRFTASISARLANAHAAVAELYMAASAPAEAVQEFRRALEIRPAFHDIRNRLAEALMQLGVWDVAREELGVALEGNPRFYQARMNLGMVHYRAGNQDAAREAWLQCRQQDPQDARVQSYLRLLEGV
jgi:tetratricopeptide (TPR) repeat protein